jgi:hypothetical protein
MALLTYFDTQLSKSAHLFAAHPPIASSNRFRANGSHAVKIRIVEPRPHVVQTQARVTLSWPLLVV